MDPARIQDLPDDDPYKQYFNASRDPLFAQSESGGSGWSWRDSYIDIDFKKLRAPQVSLTDNLICLKAFYMLYFGYLRVTTNMGALLEQILARSPSFTSTTESLVIYDSKGTIDPTPYVPSANLEHHFKEFLKENIQAIPDEARSDSTVPPPVEPKSARLVGADDQGPQFSSATDQVGYNEYPTTSEQDQIDFKINVQIAFKMILQSKEDSQSLEPQKSSDEPPNKESAAGPSAKTTPQLASEKTSSVDHSIPGALRSLHLTATYLILVMLRRITKRDVDIVAAFGKNNIHRHYTDMVPGPLGIALPAPALPFNQAMAGAVSASMEAGRHIGTILLYLMKSCTASSSDTPVGFLGQERIGLEAILKATCMTHIAGAGLPLATLFVAVKTLYNKSEVEAIQWLSFVELRHSIVSIMQVRLEHFKVAKEKKDSVKLFPYCRLVHQNYHPNLSYKGNEEICYFMASLVDLKCPPAAGTGGAKGAMWTQKLNVELKREIESRALAMYTETARFTLTPLFLGQKTLPVTPGPGTTWQPPTDADEEGSEHSITPTTIDKW